MQSTKDVIPSCNPLVNLLLHIICCFDSSFPCKPSYREKAGEWLLPEERELLLGSFRLDQAGKAATTDKFAFLFQIPAYFSGTTIESLEKVARVMRIGSLKALKDRFPEKAVMLDAYMPLELQEAVFGTALKSNRASEEKLLDKYVAIVRDVHSRFYREYWRKIHSLIRDKAKLLHRQYLSKTRLIELWESEIGLDFPYPRFVVELVDPISSIGTSLMAERDAFPYWLDSSKLFTVISHEVGTHILLQTKFLESPDVARLVRSNRERTTRIIEALANQINLELPSKNHLPREKSTMQKISEHFSWETNTLKNQWRDWRRGYIQLDSLIISSFEALEAHN